MTTHESTGALGSTQNRQKAATNTRIDVIKSIGSRWYIHLSIGTALLILLVTMAVRYDFSLFWELVVGTCLIIGGGKLAASKEKNASDHKELLWIWPNTIRVIGMMIIFLSLVNSLIGSTVQSVVNSLDDNNKDVTVLSCSISGGESEACQELGARRMGLARAQTRPRQQINMPLTHAVKVPMCDKDKSWSNSVVIPAKRDVQSAWSSIVIRAQFRQDGFWKEAEERVVSVSSDAVRYCTRSRTYAGELMPLTWYRRK